VEGRVEFRVDDEVASLEDGEVRPGGLEEPDAVIEADAAGFFHLLVDGDITGVEVRGDENVLQSLLVGPAAVTA
jgi:hypothetical protein